jgi:hypothetical protein
MTRIPALRERFLQRRLLWLRKNSQRVIPKGWVCPRNLLFLGFGEEKQIPRFARDDKKHFFRNLFCLRGFIPARTKTHWLKPALQKNAPAMLRDRRA